MPQDFKELITAKPHGHHDDDADLHIFNDRVTDARDDSRWSRDGSPWASRDGGSQDSADGGAQGSN